MNEEIKDIFQNLSSEKHYVPNTISVLSKDRNVLNVTAGQNANWTYANFFILDADCQIDNFSINEGQYVVAKRNSSWVILDCNQEIVANGLTEMQSFVDRVAKAESLRLQFLEGNEEPEDITSSFDSETIQVIYYGAPGTGKSHKIKGKVKPGNHVRTTFHPDSDYASFVGAYKPTMRPTTIRDMAGHIVTEKEQCVYEDKIAYDFVAQAFLQAYVHAWLRTVGLKTNAEGKRVLLEDGDNERFYLVIEEINRGNCAQIFGDLFQLLDRDDNGESSYAIWPDRDIQKYLAGQFAGLEDLPEKIRNGSEMKLPSNLYILATMNTSDQSLFPIDSAFKRRWDWEYIPISDEKKGYYITADEKKYSWSSFLDKINSRILDVTQSDDKQMGYWFVHLPEGQKEIKTEKFVGKVLFYLWNDVFKDFGDGEDTIFIGKREDNTEYELRFKDFFGSERDIHIQNLMRKNEVEEYVEEADDEKLLLENATDAEAGNDVDTKWLARKLKEFWTGLDEIIVDHPDLRSQFNRAHGGAYLYRTNLPGVNMRFSAYPVNWKQAGVFLRVAKDDEQYQWLVDRTARINELTGQNYQWDTDRNYHLLKLMSPKFDFDNPDEVTPIYNWLIENGEKLLAALKQLKIE